jgi:hypothetical protein
MSRVEKYEFSLRPIAAVPKDDSDHAQIVERLGWTPRQRLDYLLDMLAFEDRARRARGG